MLQFVDSHTCKEKIQFNKVEYLRYHTVAIAQFADVCTSTICAPARACIHTHTHTYIYLNYLHLYVTHWIQMFINLFFYWFISCIIKLD